MKKVKLIIWSIFRKRLSTEHYVVVFLCLIIVSMQPLSILIIIWLLASYFVRVAEYKEAYIEQLYMIEMICIVRGFNMIDGNVVLLPYKNRWLYPLTHKLLK